MPKGMSRVGFGVEWATHRWNPVSGCKRNCPGCWAMAMARRFKRTTEPTFHRDRLGQPFHIPRPCVVAVSLTGDLFGPWVPNTWISTVLAEAALVPQHVYLFLTHFPERFEEFQPYKSNWCIGASARDQRELDAALAAMMWVKHPKKFISIEPLVERVIVKFNEWQAAGVTWAIVGGWSGSRKATPWEWYSGVLIQRYTQNCGCQNQWMFVFQKANLHASSRLTELPPDIEAIVRAKEK